MADGKPLPHGASKLVTVVGEDGTVFLPDAAPGMTLEVQSAGKTVCTMTLDLPKKAETSVLYESAMATCR